MTSTDHLLRRLFAVDILTQSALRLTSANVPHQCTHSGSCSRSELALKRQCFGLLLVRSVY